MVFPRNQISMPHIRICAEEGLIAYRGVEVDPYVAAGNGRVDRAKRFADTYVDLAGPCCGAPSKDSSKVALHSGSSAVWTRAL